MMEKIDNIVSHNKDMSVKSEKSIKPEDVIIVTPTKPMTVSEVLEEMKKQGLRSLTIEELETLLSTPKSFGRIEPKDSDIVIKETSKPKELL